MQSGYRCKLEIAIYATHVFQTRRFRVLGEGRREH